MLNKHDDFAYFNISDGLTSCGGERISNESHIIYKNTIRDKEKTASSIVERAEVLIPFQCVYENELEVNLKQALEPTKRTIVDLTCEEARDRSPKCSKLKKYCHAPKYVEKMKQNCRSSCGFCRKTCKDANQFACIAGRSRCFSDQEFAEKVCPKTCGLCE
ncbi:Oidioi.mRNA.OKI2018_I69.chr1.g2817.t1.cds [Oikopleura dioica]|uniref:Oidioi.mRNA.OKI2018_I69.chr1.g2817.t1.cds n=1 Tax=Oikopleura dioica TaxID=34765 RepID=A0ABN7SS95_OIKDI|nr:Oidioi.mRNA.OKI2018_I69.chr1.g2817.t1.cds [Oikopleura dioica]